MASPDINIYIYLLITYIYIVYTHILPLYEGFTLMPLVISYGWNIYHITLVPGTISRIDDVPLEHCLPLPSHEGVLQFHT